MAIHEIQESVKYIKWSMGKRIKFRELVQENGVISATGLRMDVPLDEIQLF